MQIYDAILRTLGLVGLVLIWVVLFVKTAQIYDQNGKEGNPAWQLQVLGLGLWIIGRAFLHYLVGVLWTIIFFFVINDFPFDLIGLCMVVAILYTLIRVTPSSQ